MDGSSIVIDFLAGLFGFAIFVYGKRASRLPHLVAGVLLMVYPYVIDDPRIAAAVGLGIVATLAVVVRMGA